ncbi:hypothetical protein CYMTET_8903 [Cymbomonas tetramitiformis]|uniref:C17orf113 probable zinc finger domain-containing protein n=1 Tax=Cymbomonas tetramitiformis TaxID=36881 RepID=A0AAE0LFJ6_9CHLO|nr:hypothetical protein CYMTET_8903 [Cymbomonas tetramitiformis]
MGPAEADTTASINRTNIDDASIQRESCEHRPGKEPMRDQATPTQPETVPRPTAANPASKEKRKSDESDLRDRKLHKTEDTRKFLQQWTEGRPWLVFDEDKRLMHCTLCQECGLNNTFTRGCASLRIARIVEHEKPSTSTGKQSDHDFAVCCAKRQREESEIARNNALVQEITGVLNAMHQAYVLAKQDISLCKFPEMLEGVEGFYIVDDLSKTFNLGLQEYRNGVMCRQFVMCLADVILEDIVYAVTRSPCYSIAVDESTDRSTTEEMVLYIWFVQPNGVPVVRFFCLKDLDQANAETITDVIIDTRCADMIFLLTRCMLLVVMVPRL